MPFINTKVSVALDPQKEVVIKQKLGQMISLIGKSEQWLMVNFEDNCHLYFQGTNNQPSAFVEVQLLGTTNRASSEQLTAAITECLRDELGIPPSRIYVKFEEIQHWGWNGRNF